MIRFLILMLLVCFTNQAWSREILGRVVTTGSPETRQTKIIPTDNGQPLALCPSKMERQIVSLSNSVLRLQGQDQKASSSAGLCLNVSEYKIIEIAPGRPAIIGILKKNPQGQIGIATDEGKFLILAKVSRGTTELMNKKVVADLSEYEGKNGDPTWLIARIFQHP